jgi:hypothetical protein
MSKNIILNCFMRIGDRVKMNWTDTSEGWDTQKRKPNGTCGVVVGFHEYFQYYDVSTAQGKKFGKYRCNGAAYVLWDDGESEMVSAHDICFEDPFYVHPEVDSIYCKIFNAEAFVEDLPELLLMVGNSLWLKESVDPIEQTGFRGQEMVIVSIDYRQHGVKCDDGVTPYPIYQVRPKNGSGGSTNVRLSEIHKCDPKSGNYWAWLNDKTKLTFDSSSLDGMEEEIRFYESLGKITQVKNPITGDYSWSEDQARSAVDQKAIHIWRKAYVGDFIQAYKIDEDLEDLRFRCFMAYGGVC